MHEHEVHNDPDPTTAAILLRLDRQTRAILYLRDEIRASQAAPPKWITANWKNLLIGALALASLIGRGDAQALLGMMLGYGAARAPVVVSTPSATAPAAPETP